MMDCSAAWLPAISFATRRRDVIQWLALLAAILFCAVVGASPAQAQTNASTSIRAGIGAPAMTLRNTGGLHFGRIPHGGRRGNATVHASMHLNAHTLADNAFMLDDRLARAAWCGALVTSGARYRAISPAGPGVFGVGGVLDVQANQVADDLTGASTAKVACE